MSEKTTMAEELSKELLISRRNGFWDVTDDVIAQADEFCEGYKDFLNRSKTERESVAATIEMAEKAGFVPFD